MMWWNGFGGGRGFMYMLGFGGILMMVFYILIIVLAIYLFVRLLNGRGNSINYTGQDKFEEKRSDPLEILKERYAKGEISDEEYDRMRQKLKE